MLTAGLAGLLLGSLRADRLAVYSAVLADPGLALERVAAWGLPAFLIVTGAATLERRTGRWPARRAAGFLGGISYSVYLVQPIILFAVGSLGQSTGLAAPWAVAGRGRDPGVRDGGGRPPGGRSPPGRGGTAAARTLAGGLAAR